MNKYKKYNAIQTQYKDDLDWISNLNNIPRAIKTFAVNLSKQDLPTKSTMKSDIAKEAIKNNSQSRHVLITTNSVNSNITNSNIAHGVFEDGALQKRKHTDDEDAANDQEPQGKGSVDDAQDSTLL
ncbi:hypothetical protein MBANPS3_009555 [Mucor bainieri]